MATPFPPVRTQIPCPECRRPVNLEVQQIVDVGQDPSQRERLLDGTLNELACPHCGTRGPIAVPLLYHDPENDLLLAFLPNGMNLSMEQEEKEIGRLTNLLMDRTPPEQRRGYMLDPTRVITYEGLVEKIMESQGVTPEELRRQTERIRTVLALAEAADDPERLDALIEEQRDALDYETLVLVSMTLQQAEETGDEAAAARYRTLRERVIDKLDLQPEEIPSFDPADGIDALIDQLLETPEGRLKGIVATNRPLIDYAFFMRLTERADSEEDEEQAQRLLALRKQLVTLTDEMDDLARKAMERAAEQLQSLLEAEDLEARIRELEPELDEAFLVLLSANMEQARQQKREDIVSLFERIFATVVHLKEEKLRPELRAVNQLLRMETREERRGRLREELRTYNPAGFIEMLEAIAADLESSGQANPDVLERLHTIADEAREIVDAEFGNTPTAPASPIFNTPDEDAEEDEKPGIILP